MSNHEHESARQALVTMLRRCADYLSGLPANDVDALLNGELELRLSVAAIKKRPRRKDLIALEHGQLADISSRLRSFDNRADGEQLLREVAPTSASLKMLARHLDVAIRREDRLDDLVRRIIESTIGFRLSTAAIQGRPLISRDRDVQPDSISTQTKK